MFHPIKLDKMRNLRFGMKAIILLEKHLKRPIASIDLDKLSVSDMAAFVWAGLHHEDKSLTIDKVVDLIDDYSDITTVFSVVGEAVSQAFGGGGDSGGDSEKNV